ncbi:MAG: hypothetical protein CVU62_10435 [Deltaproteobacteria bacterium HGW-Deltaproteobacteria-2]|jgi:hypothetical protein|nr:MAG: hypothetical protein CVU62_10435 [Deltaproteobacteria bacterium HGW-Deltaproteobacteria-2]
MWEVLSTVGNDIRSDRQQVLGGWIVRTFKTNEYGKVVDQAFVSDPNHKWKVYKEPSKTKAKKP